MTEVLTGTRTQNCHSSTWIDHSVRLSMHIGLGVFKPICYVKACMGIYASCSRVFVYALNIVSSPPTVSTEFSLVFARFRSFLAHDE